MTADATGDKAAHRRGGPERPIALIVDPDDLARRVTAEIVGAAGFEIHLVSGGDSAVAYLVDRKHVDVLFVCATLPEMPGRDLAAILAKDFPDLRCVFLLRPGEEADQTPALRKPFTRRDLERALKSLEAGSAEEGGPGSLAYQSRIGQRMAGRAAEGADNGLRGTVGEPSPP